MKKMLVMLSLLMMLPLNLIAYSKEIIPGGENIGISISTDGLVVVGFYKVNDKYIGSENLKVGDVILEIEGIKPDSINDMTRVIDDSITSEGTVNIKIKRNNKEIDTMLQLVKNENIYKTGLYIKDKINGIGTLTYIDPNTKIFGALGHEIVMSDTNSAVEVRSGSIYESYVKGVDRSADGTVGSKNATIMYNNVLGNITKNTKYGIYGIINGQLENKDTIEVANFRDIKVGPATIYTILNDKNIESYNIEITKIDEGGINTSKAISFTITDSELLEATGGIVQGMSGSPIIQNNKIIGAVTHVVVEDVKRGYAIFIKTMLEEGER